MEKELTLDLIELLLDSLTLESDDYAGVLPIDLNKLDLCNPDAIGTIDSVVNPTAPNTMEEIEALCNSDYIQNLLDADKVKDMVNNLMQNAINGLPTDNLKAEGNFAIIEFGDDYTNGEKVDYELYVKPGLELQSSTIMGQVKQHGVFTKLRSLFSSGTVLADPKNPNEFARLFPSKTARHIIIADYQLSDGIGYDDKAFAAVGDNIALNTELYNLIKDYICYSTLPIILSNHETKEEHEKHPILIDPENPGVPYVNCDFTNSKSAISLYNDLMDKYIDIFKKGGDDIKKIVDAKKIQATNGSTAGMNIIKDEIMAFREKLLQDVINLYMPAHNKQFNVLPYDNYKDCLELSNFNKKQLTEYESIFMSGNYANYYMYLLSCIDVTMFQNNKYYKEYYNILSDIIKKRNFYESKTASKKQLIKEFNDLFKDNIREYTEDEIKNNYLGYDMLYASANPLPNNEYVNVVVNAIHNIINSSINNAAKKLADDYIKIGNLKPQQFIFPELYIAERDSQIKAFNNYFKKYIQQDPVKDGYTQVKNKNLDTVESITEYIVSIADNLKDEKLLGTKKVDAINRIARLFIYLKDMDEITDELKLEFTDEFTPLDLVKEEASKLKAFWLKCITTYNNNSIDSCLKNMEDEIGRLTQYAEWPLAVTTTIEGLQYQHFIFSNPLHKTDISGADDGDPNIANYDITNTNTDKNPADDLAMAEAAALVSEAAALKALNEGVSTPNVGSEPSITDTAYWVKYFSLATIISLPFLADGFDVPPMMTPIPMPGIYIAFKAIYIKPLDMVTVIGLAIRGIWIFPIVLVVNLSNKSLSVLTPLVSILNQIREMFKSAISQIELTIPNLTNLIICKLEKENADYMAMNKMYEALLKTLENAMVENEELLKMNMKLLTHPNIDTRQGIFRTNDVVLASL